MADNRRESFSEPGVTAGGEWGERDAAAEGPARGGAAAGPAENSEANSEENSGAEASAGDWGRRLGWPVLFVLLWSTGFIGAKLGLPHADALSFLAARFFAASVLLGLWLLLLGGPWPAPRLWGMVMLVGVLNHGVYLGGVFIAIGMGLNAGMAALIAGLSPVFTALIATLMGLERLTPKRWLGMALGFGGVALAVSPKIDLGALASGGEAGLAPPLLVLCSAASLAVGAILQRRRLGSAPLASGGFLQAAAATVFYLLALGLAVAFGWTPRFVPDPELLLALAWLVLVLTIGAISLFFILLRRGEASSVSSLFFMTPAASAFIGWLMFGETLGAAGVAGFVIATIGVALAAAGPAPAPAAVSPSGSAPAGR